MKILYNKNKWLDIYNLPKYQEIRNKILTKFNDLIFIDDGHKYFLNGEELECVSNVTHRFQEKIDSLKLATETYERNFNNPKSKYYGYSVEDILMKWKKKSDDACKHGSFTHEFAESAFYYMIGQYDKILPDFKDRMTEDNGFKAISAKEEAVVKFYEDIPVCIVPILAETKVFVEYEKGGYAGTFDILFYYDAEIEGKNSERSGLFCMDWKTNEDLYKNFNKKKLLSPFDGLLDMPLSLYKLQLSAYENALYKIGMKVVGRRILWLLPDGEYEKINLESYRKELDNELKKIYK